MRVYMSKTFFESAEEFRKEFDLESDQTYIEYRALNDRKVGFSLQRLYPKDIRYIPPKSKDGKPDVVALIHVVYTHPDEAKETFDSERVPLVLRITKYSRYINIKNRICYDFNNDNCPTKESVEISKSTPEPMSLEFIGDFFYDHSRTNFIDSKGNTLSGRQVLDNVFDKHCATVHWLKGLKLRFHVRFNRIRTKINEILIKFLKYLLINAFGRTLEPKDPISSVLGGYSKEDLKMTKTNIIEFRGYKASKNIIVTFCLIYLILYFIGIKIKLIKDIFFNPNPLLVVPIVILILVFLDNVVPKFILWLINKRIKMRLKLYFKKFKF